MDEDEVPTGQSTPPAPQPASQSLTQSQPSGPNAPQSEVAALANATAKALKTIRSHERTMGWIQTIVYLGFVVIIIMVASFLVDVWNNKGASSEAVSDQINQQSLEIQKLSDEIDSLNSSVLQTEQNLERVTSTSTTTPTSTPSLIR